ncbi:MAG TPA: sugar ABC transporter permease [Candidatus Brachybacterium merdigallinarum]|nr:sugar ABC transporter permease [Candidatus Brachybacterium merdigallinarum]
MRTAVTPPEAGTRRRTPADGDPGPSAPPPRRRQQRGPRAVSWYTPWLFLLPIAILFVVFFLWPAVLAVQLAFYDYSVIRPAELVGLDNFRRMLGDERFWRAALNSLLYMVGLIPLNVVIPLVLAVMVNQKIRAIGAFRAIYYLPAITSMVAVAIAWRYVYNDAGIVNWVLQAFGITEQPIQFLLSTDWALPSILFIEAWKQMGTYMLIYLAGLQAISSDVYEAATIDGANTVQKFLRITVPLTIPYVAVVLTLTMESASKVFTSVFVLTGGGPDDSTMSLGYYIWSLAFQRFEMGYASAIALVLWAVLIVLAMLNFRVSRSRYDV